MRTRNDGPAGYMAGITDLALCEMPGSSRVFSISGSQGGLLCRNPDSAMAITATQAHPATEARASAAGLELVYIGGRAALLRFGTGAGLQANWLGSTGEVGTSFALPIAPSGTILAIKAVAGNNGSTLIFNSTLQNPGITVWLRSADGRVSFVQQLIPQGTQAGYDTVDLQVVSRAEGRYLLALSAQGNTLSVFAIGANTQTPLVDLIGADDGLWVGGASKLAIAQMGGRDFVLLGASGSSSITVLELGASGRLQVIDQVLDDLTTRFQGVTVLETATVNGQVFVVAGGGDDGLSLFALLPSGRLVHLESIADATGGTLENVSALTLRVSAAGLDVFVAGLGAAGVSQFHLDLGSITAPQIANDQGQKLQGGAGSDLLMGGDGADQLYGGAGADILFDGGGADQLYGGTGADVFVFQPDGLRDELRDFEPGIDRLDLTALGRIYSRDAIEFIAMTGGILLRVAGEDIALYAADGKVIGPGQLTDADLFGPGHTQPIVQPDTPRAAYGTNLSEMFVGRGGNDTLLGGAGNDLLDGAGGNDWLLGGWDNDQLFGRDGDDTLWSGSGNDTCFGGQGADVLYGELGDDALWGREGNDLVWGNLGNDLLAGEAGSDTLWGGNGNDTLWGGDGWDALRGEWGDDQLCGDAGDDLLSGGDGNDWLLGNDGSDRLEGDLGNDLMQGGDGDDLLLGSLGDDTLLGGRGSDRLVGGPGRNVLTGGENADAFVFNVAAGGLHRVTDFHPEDRVELQGFGYGSFAAVQAHLSQSGAAVIFADKGLEIIFDSMTLAQFQADDFGF